jgi:hypothetical protein
MMATQHFLHTVSAYSTSTVCWCPTVWPLIDIQQITFRCSHRAIAKDSGLVACDAVSFPTFRTIACLTSARVRQSVYLLDT